MVGKRKEPVASEEEEASPEASAKDLRAAEKGAGIISICSGVLWLFIVPLTSSDKLGTLGFPASILAGILSVILGIIIFNGMYGQESQKDETE